MKTWHVEWKNSRQWRKDQGKLINFLLSWFFSSVRTVSHPIINPAQVCRGKHAPRMQQGERGEVFWAFCKTIHPTRHLLLKTTALGSCFFFQNARTGAFSLHLCIQCYYCTPKNARLYFLCDSVHLFYIGFWNCAFLSNIHLLLESQFFKIKICPSVSDLLIMFP